MKVALIGTHGVGKTTLCYELAARLKRRDVNVEMVQEVARRCPLPINRETSLAAQSWILHTQMAWEIQAEADHQVVICDRSVLDNYCYLVHATGPQPAWEPLLSRWLLTYDLLVKVPLWSAPRWDGVRDVDLVFQRAIDQLIDLQMRQRGLACLDLTGHEPSRWGQVVMARLEPIVCPMPPLFPEEDDPIPFPTPKMS
ncbi:MAG: ATP-binding protein [Thermoanaerobaculaceae bacterium]|nr:ATP-binding protein [Thermoanaerobaculaceae bacterium]MDI9620885.1 ATP-binding protein [Acidobacteriota bacterium]NLH10155.1 ATP-binding protein [Holophagae bacterium]HPW54753.1 ATP-binding protein [Thermoanaerobaculaceae bacterium]